MSNIADPGRLGGQLARFVVIGSLSAATDLGGYYLLTELGIHAGIAKGISFLLGMVLGWIGNKFWTFASPTRDLAEPLIYVLWYATTLGLNVMANAVLLWALSPHLTEHGAKAAAAILATGISATANFAGLRWIVFARRVPG